MALSLKFLDNYRSQLARVDALPQLALVGVISGLITGGFICLFRLALDLPLSALLPDNNPENFEALSTNHHFAMPLIGALILAVMFGFLPMALRRTGIVHVLERLDNHQGHLPLSNLLVQFFGGLIALGSGQSCGREGPAIHLGSASSSLLGQWLRLPNNSIRLLVGCGTAAAIAASFNTPIAGVIFAMEVILMEYSVASFTPIITASISATLVSRAVFGDDPAFSVPLLTVNSLWDMILIAVLGFIVGGAAAVFSLTVKFFLKFSHIPQTARIVAAGLICALLAIAVPQIMGVGYDSVTAVFEGQYLWWFLLFIVAAKIIATAAFISTGLPGGLIGPTFVIGSAIGGIVAYFAELLTPSLVTAEPGFYVLIGMGAMMGAVLHAPLAALLALLELTYNPHIIMPGMLAIIIGNITCASLFKQQSILSTLCKRMGLDYNADPMVQALSRVGIASVMDTAFQTCPDNLSNSAAKSVLKTNPRWLNITSSGKSIALLQASSLARYMEQEPDAQLIDLLEIPGNRCDIVTISSQATLLQAMQCFKQDATDVLCIENTLTPVLSPIVGVITKECVEDYYRV